MKTFQRSAVIFDMDGVITDTMPYHFKAWHDVFKHYGVDVSFNDVYKREGQKGIDSVREIFQERGKDFSEGLAKEILLQKEEYFKAIFKRKFIIGSRPFLRSLLRKKFRLALVTGTSRHEAKKLLPVSIWDSFEVTVCGCDVQNGKPHPEPYLKALKGLALSPDEALVLENAPFGIRSAKSAGLACIALATSLPRSYLNQADLVVNGYKQLINQVSFVRL